MAQFKKYIYIYIYKCFHFKHAKGGYKTKNIIWFLMLGNDSLYFAIILLTPSATRTIMFGSPNIPHVLGKKGKLLFTCHYSPVTIHWYYSLLLFTQKFCLFKGGCPLYSRQVFLVQNFFLRERLPLRAFLCENFLAYTSYFLLTLPTFSTKPVTSKAL